MAKTSKRRTQKRNQKRSQKRRQQRGGSSGWMRDPTFPTGLSAARYQPLQTPAEQGGAAARLVGGRRSRRQRFTLRKQNGGGLLSTGGFADLGSAYRAGVGTTGGLPSQGVQYSTIPPITTTNTPNTTTNTYQNGSVVSHQF